MENIIKRLEQNAKERDEEVLKESRRVLAEKLEPFVLGYLTRKKYAGKIRENKSRWFNAFTDLEKTGKVLMSNEDVLEHAPNLLKNPKNLRDYEVICLVCRHIIISMDSVDKRTNFASTFLNKETIGAAKSVVETIIAHIPRFLVGVNGDKTAEIKCWQCFIHFVIVLSSSSGWALVRNNQPIQNILNSLCAKMLAPLYEKDNYRKLANALYFASNERKPRLSSEAFNAHFCILLKPLKGDDVALINEFIAYVLVCPAVLLHLNQLNLEQVKSVNLLGKCLTWIKENQEELESNMDVKNVLNLLGNLIQLGVIQKKEMSENVFDWTWAIGITLSRCTEVACGRTKNSRQYFHPIFGNYPVQVDQSTEGALNNVLHQLRLLWSSQVVRCLFDKALEGVREKDASGTPSHSKELGSTFIKLWKKLGGTIDTSPGQPNDPEPPPTLAAVVCQLYMSALSTMDHMKSEIVSGICRDDQILRLLWAYVKSWGAKAVTSSFASEQSGPIAATLLAMKRPASPYTAVLRLFLDACTAIVSILDEEEMFEKQIPFPTKELEAIAMYTNVTCLRAIWNRYVDESNIQDDNVFTSAHNLCMVLYERDSRRSFVADPKNWIVSDFKPSMIMSEFEKKTARAQLVLQKMSHVVPIKDRLLLFRRKVNSDKQKTNHINDTNQTWITVMRSRLIEDGFRQLSKLSTLNLKSTIRVKFINEQGLDEAGIDQDGVFKEFLEMTLMKVFDPQLNLFQTTSTGVMYPSATSSLHDDHLSLFKFVGKMLAKAIYEGIVVDVLLAPVLLAAVIGGHRLCAFDELAQIDPELYKSLTFVKRYDGDITDLALTFSADEDFMGKVSTVDLMPGGRTVPVTNENKIDYVHRMAHHRVFKRTFAQCHAFVEGMHMILQTSWLSLFAPHDLQCLISGQNTDIDLNDLKRHVQYYGGFHGNHRLIRWLWEILENKFTSDERKLFLKFVTSCSRPPLLGFSYLEPPFSIRCVEVSDDQDQGDTLGSVVRGFLTLRKGTTGMRLPTASTCFNLLKLPNYNKKSVLLEKLRYAIHAESGFELS